MVRHYDEMRQTLILEQPGTDQRRACKIKFSRRECRNLCIQAFVNCYPMRLYGYFAVDNALVNLRVMFVKAGPQGVVPGDYVIETLLQRIDIHRA